MFGKKGLIGLVGLIITATIVALLLVNLLIPQVKNTTAAQEFSEDLLRDDAPNNETVNLTQDAANIVATSLAISGLTVDLNYTVNYTAASVRFNATTINGTYTTTYDYFTPGYLETAGQRALMGVVILAGIIGLVYLLFKGFGVA